MTSPQNTLKSTLLSLYDQAPLFVKLYVRLRLPFVNNRGFHLFLPPQGKILDLGCGYGLLANLLSLNNDGWYVVGIDSNPNRIEQARLSIKDRDNIEFHLGDARKFPLDANVVILTDFLHHLKFEDQDKMLEDIHQQLCPGGTLILLEASTKPKLKSFMSRLSDCLLYPFDEKANFRDPEELASTLNCIGFKVNIFERTSKIFAGIGYACEKMDDV
jgi:ubiquinone/menaquinone biosynthesis C-methylase UbiE